MPVKLLKESQMLKKLILYVVLISTCFAFNANANISDLRTQLASLRADIEQERQVNQDLKEALESRYSELEKLRDKLKNITEEIALLKSRYNL